MISCRIFGNGLLTREGLDGAYCMRRRIKVEVTTVRACSIASSNRAFEELVRRYESRKWVTVNGRECIAEAA